jgi:hypothetical protein
LHQIGKASSLPYGFSSLKIYEIRDLWMSGGNLRQGILNPEFEKELSSEIKD